MVNTSDPRNFRRRLERQRELLADAAIDEADRREITSFAQRKDGNVSVSTLKTYLRRLRRAAEWAPVPLTEISEAEYREFIFNLRHDSSKGRGDGPLSDATLKSYEDITCQFLEVECGREWAGEVERTTVEATTVDASEMLTLGNIQALRDACRHQRDVALVEFLADTGARITLVCSLRVKDVSLDGDRATYQPNADALGLKGAEVTPYPVIDAKADLKTYLRGSHPRSDEPNAALFHRLRRWDDDIEVDDGACDPSALRNHLVRIGERAGIEKPTNPHNFRHSAITRMVREGYSRDQIEHRVHWSLDTDMWEIYEHVTSEEHNSDIFREAGVVDQGDGPERVRKPCGNCRTPLAPHHEFCPQCGSAVSAAADDTVDDARAAIMDDLVDATNPAQRRELRQLLEDLDDQEDLAHSDPS